MPAFRLVVVVKCLYLVGIGQRHYIKYGAWVLNASRRVSWNSYHQLSLYFNFHDNQRHQNDQLTNLFPKLNLQHNKLYISSHNDGFTS